MNMPTELHKKYEPKNRFRWVVSIRGLDSFLMHSAARPTMHKSSGMWVYEPLNITMVDAIEPSGAKQVWEWIQNDDSRDISLKLLDATGVVIEEWIYRDARVIRAAFGELNYVTSNDVVTIDMGLNYTSVQLL